MLTKKKTLIAIGFLLIATFILGYSFRSTLIVKSLGFMTRVANPVLPNQSITWSTGAWTTPAGQNAQRPPNIIIILTDDMGFNDVSTYGGGLIKTPHIDALAKDGVRFENGYAGSAVCSPSRAMLLTGRYATRYGFEFTPTPDAMVPILRAMQADDPMPRKMKFTNVHEAHDLPFRSRGLPSAEITLAEELKKAGYHSLHIGKWHLGLDDRLTPNAQGFDESLLMASGLYLPIDSPNVVNARNDFSILDNVQWELFTYAASFNGGPRFEPEGYLTDYYTQEAVKAIEANKSRPFFLYLSHWGVHTPLQALKSDYDALANKISSHQERVYAGMIRAVDRSVGAVMKALKDNGLDDNTLIIFTSDNGGANYIGIPDTNKPYRGWKLTFFEGGTHIPFFMRWPKTLPANLRYANPVSHLDIMPTALAAAGIATSTAKLDGVDLVPYLTGQKSGQPHNQLIWREGHYQAIMHRGWKLQINASSKITRLYNLELDPFEKTDLSLANAAKVQELMALLTLHNEDQAEPLWPSQVEIPIWIDKSLGDAPTLDDDYIYWPN